MGDSKPHFQAPSTALWRGYVGSWEIVDDRLYLVELERNSGKRDGGHDRGSLSWLSRQGVRPLVFRHNPFATGVGR